MKKVKVCVTVQCEVEIEVGEEVNEDEVTSGYLEYDEDIKDAIVEQAPYLSILEIREPYNLC